MNETLQTIRVIAAVIRRDDSWLLGLRPSQKRHGGLWEFPGGKYEMGATAAANRELQEGRADVRRCSQCQHEVMDITFKSKEEVSVILWQNPSACIHVDLEQSPIQVIPHAP